MHKHRRRIALVIITCSLEKVKVACFLRDCYAFEFEISYEVAGENHRTKDYA